MKHWMFGLILSITSLSQAATFTVTTTSDSGGGSLRAAISNANHTAGSHLINFAIPGAGVHTIQPLTSLDSLIRPTTIDGYSQPGSSVNTLANDDNAVLLIELDGTIAGGDGIFVGTNCVVRGLAINRFLANGINVSNLGGGSLIEGNFIGTDPTGTIKRPNSEGLLIGGANTIVGGTTPDARNLISGNATHGLATGGIGVTGVLIEGNFIGTDVHGTAALGNASLGIRLVTATKTTIGGAAAGAGNVISGNGLSGVAVNTSTNFVLGNFIGTDLSGTLNLSNHVDGVTLTSASDNKIGGAAGNIIAFNGGAGVSVSQGVPNRTNNLISANGIFSNGALGIDLDALGVTSNDTCNAGAGANRLQNFPVITSATSDGSSSITIAGFLHSVPSTIYTLEFFVNNVCDPSGFGEGETFIGSTNVLTGANCTNVFTATLPVGVPEGLVLTATATDPNNNTSEFSRCVPIASAAPFRITAITRTGNDIRVTWTMSPGQTNALQRTAGAPNGSYSTNNFAPIFSITNTVGSVTNYLDVGAASSTSTSRYYRVRLVP